MPPSPIVPGGLPPDRAETSLPEVEGRSGVAAAASSGPGQGFAAASGAARGAPDSERVAPAAADAYQPAFEKFAPGERSAWKRRIEFAKARLDTRPALHAYFKHADGSVEGGTAARGVLRQLEQDVDRGDGSRFDRTRADAALLFVLAETVVAEAEERIRPNVDIKVNASDAAIAKALTGCLVGRGSVLEREMDEVRRQILVARETGIFSPEHVEDVDYKLACIELDLKQADLEKRMRGEKGKGASFLKLIPDGGNQAHASLSEARDLLQASRRNGRHTADDPRLVTARERVAYANLEVVYAELQEKVKPGTGKHDEAIVGKLRFHMAEGGKTTDLILARAQEVLLASRPLGRLNELQRGEIVDRMEFARLDVEVAGQQKRLERKREGPANAASVLMFDRATHAGLEAVEHIDRARAELSAMQRDPALDPTSAHRIGAFAKRGKVAADAYDKKRADLTEYIAANAAYMGAKGWMNARFAKRPDMLRWDEVINPETGRLNWMGLFKEFVAFEVPNVAVRFLTMGKDFNPFDPETKKALWGEIGGAAIATAGTLTTSMLLRKHTPIGRMGDLGRILSSVVGCAVFSTIAGYVSYAAIPEEARGSDLMYASFRATKNGVARYAAIDMVAYLLKPFGGFSHVWAKLGSLFGAPKAALAQEPAMAAAAEHAMAA